MSDDQAPGTHEVTQRPDGLEQLFLDGASYKESPTRFFAILGTSDKPLESDIIESGRTPAVVLVHGGGGTAFSEWVRRWNAAGFAAISIAVEGQTDEVVGKNLRGPNRWKRHALGGPPRSGIYGDSAEQTGDEWMFHAVFATIQAHNFLRSRPEIDSAHIGIVGISWGGVIALTAIGFDTRFSFAVSIYGSGHLARIPNQYGHALAGNLEFARLWEPALRLNRFAKPSLWLTGRAENNFFLPAQAASYRSVAGSAAVSIKPGMRHGHEAGWNEPESYAFASAVTQTGKTPFVPNEAITSDNGTYTVSFRISNALAPQSATAFATPEKVIDPESSWREIEAELVSPRKASNAVEVHIPSIPAGTAHWFVILSLTREGSDDVLTASSRLNSSVKD